VTISIDVVIPTHNRWDLTKKCLEHLRTQTVAHAVIVADNASTDGTSDHVREAFRRVRVIELGDNRGFSVACNAGVRAGTGEYIVLLNNDVECRPDFLDRLTAPLEAEPDVGSVAALLLSREGETIESFGVAVDRTLAGYPRLRGTPLGEAWEEVGGLDEAVFAYGEDVDLALRLQSGGWSAATARDAVAIHKGSATAITRSAWQRYQGGFSRGYFLRRYGVLRSSAAIRALSTEAIVVLGDTLVFSRDLAALRGRIAGWRAAAGKPRRPWPPDDAIDSGITFLESLRLRLGVYKGA